MATVENINATQSNSKGKYCSGTNEQAIDREWSRGSTASVQIANKIGTKEIQAMKVFAKGSTSSAYQREKKHHIDSEQTAKQHGYGELKGGDASQGQILQEFCPQGELWRVLQHTGGLVEQEASSVCLQVALGVSDIHANGVAHLDLKLANILIDSRFALKIVDFGCARPHDAVLNGPEGTPHCMAPELDRPDGSCNDLRRADMWSLGVVLFSVVAGFPPYKEPSVSDNMFRTLVEGDWDKCADFWNRRLHKSNRSSLSPTFVHLLQGLLTVADARLTIQDVLNHRWFKDANTKLSANVLKKRLMSMQKRDNFNS